MHANRTSNLVVLVFSKESAESEGACSFQKEKKHIDK